MTPDCYWHSSLRDAYAWIEGFAFRHELEAKAGVSRAWLTAAWSRANRLPQLKQVLSRMEGRRAAEQADPERIRQARDDLKRMAEEMVPPSQRAPAEGRINGGPRPAG